MLKYTVLFATMFYVVQSQRPWHAGTGNRLPQVLPQYIDERIAAEQAAQATQTGQTAQGDQIIPANQGTQGIAVGQGIQGIAMGQGTQGIAVGQGAQDIPVRQGAQGIPMYQGSPTYQGAQGTQITGADGTLLGNRIDSGGGSFATASPLNTTINPADLPVDAHGDIDLVNRIKTWPRDKQPFWYINWQAIQAHRGDVNNTGQPAQTQPSTRSFFAG
ncbi:PREDICTED: uncharacterized protein LOC105450713 [Wasmannia auropunctata]|uniref:uncharacterized protein LOC105450713 n=1 Tax=Wasmannia auropunctata TaxID=64793 RepID=UPI0005EFF41F|nr:PREDICTED: uncharacterized protein LOC105450713 [Wasmannia auropunctata]